MLGSPLTGRNATLVGLPSAGYDPGPCDSIPLGRALAMISIECPHCGRVGSSKATIPAGSRVRCPGCQQRFEIQGEPDIIELDAVDLDQPIGTTDQGIDLTSHQPTTVPPNNPISGSTSSASTVTTPPIPPPPPQSVFVPNRSTPQSFIPDSPLAMLMVVVAILLFAGGTLTWFAPSSRFYPESSSVRFKTDNAYGAAANAVEHLAQRQDASHPGTWMIAGLICVLIYSVERLRQAVVWTAPR